MALGQEASSLVCIWPHWVAMVLAVAVAVAVLLQVESSSWFAHCFIASCQAEGSNCKKSRKREGEYSS